MDRRKLIRTPEEGATFESAKRKKKSENQSRRRSNLKSAQQTSHSGQATNHAETQPEDVSVFFMGNIGTSCNMSTEIRREIVVPRGHIVEVLPHAHDQERNGRLSDMERQRRCRQRRIETRNEFPARPIDDVEEHYGGSMNELCIHCNASHFPSEKISNMHNSFHDCCSHGRVDLEPLPAMPNELDSLFAGTHEKSNVFFERIRNYNASFSFASFNANLMDFEGRRPGPYCFKI